MPPRKSRPQHPSSKQFSAAERLHPGELIDTDWDDANANRLIKRLRRHREDLFTFLDKDGVPFENNHAERSIRPAVILRKNSYGNRSEQGADCQAVQMSIFRSLKQRGHNPIITATQNYLASGKLPPPRCQKKLLQIPEVLQKFFGLKLTTIKTVADPNGTAGLARWFTSCSGD